MLVKIIDAVIIGLALGIIAVLALGWVLAGVIQP